MSAPKEQTLSPAMQPSEQQDVVLPEMTQLAESTISGTGPGPKLKPHDTPAGQTAQKIGHWVHTHKTLPQKSFLGFTAYQYLRSCIASIPYGISMAVTLGTFNRVEWSGKKMAESANAGAFKRGLGNTMKHVGGFGPLRLSAMIATSFTLYRGTSKLVKWMTEYLFNPKDSEEKTVAKVRDLPSEAWRKVKEIGPAEVNSTPVAAFALGFISSVFQKGGYPFFNKGTNKWDLAGGISPKYDWTHKNYETTKGFGAKLNLLKNVIVKPDAHFIPQALINTLAYSVFFEIGDRLYKDRQIKRGVWPGDHNSIKALKATPDAYEEGIHKQNDTADGKYADSARVAIPMHHRYGAFSSEPTVTRFVFRRVFPTLLGIGAYTAFKFRHSYMVFGDLAFDPSKKIRGQIPKMSLLEGGATSLFFLVPFFSEPWEKAYDKFWDNKEKAYQAAQNLKHNDGLVQAGAAQTVKADNANVPSPANDNGGVSLGNEQIQKNYANLLEKLTAKERSQGVSAR